MNLTELKADTLFLSDTVITQYREEDLERNINRYYDEIITAVWDSESAWKFDKKGDDHPIVYTDLVEGQRDYEIPTDARKIERVEITYNDNKYRLTAASSEDVKIHKEDDEGRPRMYYLKGNSIFLFPRSDKEVLNGLEIHISRSVDELEDGEDEPKIEKEFHRYLSLGAAHDWFLAKNNLQKSREFERKMDKIREEVRKFYSNRSEDYRDRIKPKVRKERYD